MDRKKVVSIIGGIGTKIKHYKSAIDVYNAYGYHVDFYEAKYKGISVFCPKLYQQNIDIAINNLKNKNPHIIHANSGGIWTGLRINSTIKHKGFIMESGPFKLDNKEFIETIERVYNIKFPIFFHSKIDKIMGLIGIPTKEKMPEWFEIYEKDLKNLPKVLSIYGKKDNIINQNFIIDFNKKNGFKLIEYDDATHISVARSNPVRYQETIENFIKEIEKH